MSKLSDFLPLGGHKTGDVLTTARTLSAPDWLLTDGAAYLRSVYPDLAMLLPGMHKLPDPSNLPANTGYGCAFSPDGTYLSVAHPESPYITIYANVGDEGDATSFTTPSISYPKTKTYIKT